MHHNEKPLLVSSISGGRSSMLMSIEILKSEKYKDYNKIFVFANTGLERIQTIDFLKTFQDKFKQKIHLLEGVYSQNLGTGVRSKEVTFDTLDFYGETYYNSVKFRNKGVFSGLPFTCAPYCSYTLKKDVINHFVKENFSKNFITSIGFRLEDMPKRISWAEIKKDNKRIYPLITDFEKPLSNFQVHQELQQKYFDLQIPSTMGNCALCWKKSDFNLVNIIKHDLKNNNHFFIDNQIQLEKEFNSTSYRSNRSIKDFLNIAKSDKTEQLSLFEEPCSCFI